MKFTLSEKSPELRSRPNSTKNAILLLSSIITRNNSRDPNILAQQLSNAKNNIINDAVSKNAVDYVLSGLPKSSLRSFKNAFNKKSFFVMDHVNDSQKEIAKLGALKIKRGMSVFVHGFSHYIMNILISAKKSKVDFDVFTTESRPNYEGRLLAKELSKQNIPVKLFSDLGLRLALKNTDLVLLGASAISDEGKVYSGIGSELISEVANNYDIPVYVCADSWSLTDSADELNYVKSHSTQILPKGVKFMDYSFERIHPKLISGVITELGIYKPRQLVSRIRRTYSWL